MTKPARPMTRPPRRAMAAVAVLLALCSTGLPAAATPVTIDIYAETPRASNSTSYVFVKVTSLDGSTPPEGRVSLSANKPGVSGVTSKIAPPLDGDLTRVRTVNTYVFPVGALAPETYVLTALYAETETGPFKDAVGTTTVQVFDYRFPIPILTGISLSSRPGKAPGTPALLVDLGPSSLGAASLFDVGTGIFLGDVVTKDGVATLDLPGLEPGPHDILVASANQGVVVRVDVAAVPEPASLALLAGALAAATGLAPARPRRIATG